jgi:hypothetical protein
MCCCNVAASTDSDAVELASAVLIRICLHVAAAVVAAVALLLHVLPQPTLLLPTLVRAEPLQVCQALLPQQLRVELFLLLLQPADVSCSWLCTSCCGCWQHPCS